MPIEFPPKPQWIPDVDRLNKVGEGVLEVAGGALDYYERGGRYERVYVGHGTEAPVVRSTAKQLTVVCTRIFLGRAGEEQFQFAKGASGKLAYQCAQFMVELSAPWPSQRGGQSSTAVSTSAVTDARQELWRDGLIVFSALLALALGGISRPWPTATERGDEIAVGPLLAKDPAGTQASWLCQLQVEL